VCPSISPYVFIYQTKFGRMVSYEPLVGIPPIYSCALGAVEDIYVLFIVKRVYFASIELLRFE